MSVNLFLIQTMNLNVPGKGRELTRRQIARLFKRSLRTIDRWGIARTDLLTAKESASRIGVSERKFFYLCDGDLDFPSPIRIGSPMWRADELDAWKASQSNTTKSQQLSLI